MVISGISFQGLNSFNFFAENGSWFDSVLRAFEKFNPADTEIEHCPELLNVHRALSTHGVLASYVALSMTKLGHM